MDGMPAAGSSVTGWEKSRKLPGVNRASWYGSKSQEYLCGYSLFVFKRLETNVFYG